MADGTTDLSAGELSRLLTAVAGRDRAAFGRLFEHFAPRVKTMMMRYGMPAAAADDLAQDTMLAVWRKAHLYDARMGGAAAWIYTIARNRRIDLARSAQRAPPESADTGEDQVDDNPLPDLAVAAAQIGGRVHAALAHLSPEQQTVIRLSFLEGQSHSEIADQLGIPLGTVKSRIRLAFQRLRDLLGDLK